MVATERLAKQRQGSSLFGAPVRQNNQNSQNEPGMSFVINEPGCARPGPDMVVTGSTETDRGRFGVNCGSVKHREEAQGWKTPNRGYRTAFNDNRLGSSLVVTCARTRRSPDPTRTVKKEDTGTLSFWAPVRQR